MLFQLKKKVDKYYNQYPIPIEKYKNAVKLHSDAQEKHKRAHDNLLTYHTHSSNEV